MSMGPASLTPLTAASWKSLASKDSALLRDEPGSSPGKTPFMPEGLQLGFHLPAGPGWTTLPTTLPTWSPSGHPFSPHMLPLCTCCFFSLECSSPRVLFTADSFLPGFSSNILSSVRPSLTTLPRPGDNSKPF